jgi:hypothetical protein
MNGLGTILSPSYALSRNRQPGEGLLCSADDHMRSWESTIDLMVKTHDISSGGNHEG